MITCDGDGDKNMWEAMYKSLHIKTEKLMMNHSITNDCNSCISSSASELPSPCIRASRTRVHRAYAHLVLFSLATGCHTVKYARHTYRFSNL